MKRFADRIRNNIYLLEVVEFLGLSLLFGILGVLIRAPVKEIVNVVPGSWLILLLAWAFYLLMIYFWRSTPLWLIIGLAILSAGSAIGLYIFLGVFDLNRVILGRVLYVGAAPLEYFWNKESSEDLREWKKARQAATSPSTKSVDTKAEPSPQESVPIAPSASQPAQIDQQQRISQLDKEISALNQEVDELNRQMPKLSNWSSLFSLLLIIGGLYTPALGSSENIGLFLLIGGILVLTGIGLMIKRNRFYKKNCKPVLDEIEKKNQYVQQLVRESQNLKNARY